MKARSSSRRRFVRGALAAAAGGSGIAQTARNQGRVKGFDHVALPMQNVAAMLEFYRGLGFDVNEGATACSVYIGDQMINFHRPETWRRESFTLRAPAARPPCGDLCFVWGGAAAELKAWLDRGGAQLVEGPVGRQGGRRKAASSVYVRDPDGNLLEFMIYN